MNQNKDDINTSNKMQEILLIDGENFQVNDDILEKIISDHNGKIKNLYADFSEEAVINFWTDKIFQFGLEQKQTLKIQGKGSVDACLMLDALEYCYNQNISKVTICGNDKDYIPLCKKLREYNIDTLVYGNGYSNIIHFCDKFVDVSNNNSNKKKEKKNKKKKKVKENKEEIIYNIQLKSDEEGYLTQFSDLSDYTSEEQSNEEESNDDDSVDEENELLRIKNYLIDYFNTNHIKRIRVKNLKKAIRKNRIMYQIMRKNLSFSKLDKALVKNFPKIFKSAMKKNGTTCYISLK